MPFKDILVLVCAIACLVIAFLLHKYTAKKFGYEFISKSNLNIVIFSLSLFMLGMFIAPNTKPLIINWVVIIAFFLVGISVTAIGYMVFINIKNTNRMYGLIGSAIQIPFLIIISFPAFLFIVLRKLFSASSGSSRKSSKDAFFEEQTKTRQALDWARNPNNMQNYYGVHQSNQRYFDSKRK